MLLQHLRNKEVLVSRFFYPIPPPVLPLVHLIPRLGIGRDRQSSPSSSNWDEDVAASPEEEVMATGIPPPKANS